MSLLAITLVLALGFTPQQSYAEGLDWTIAPYLWASDVGMDVAINGDPTLGVDAAFNDLLDKVDMAFMGHIEASSGSFGGFFDVIYLSLGDDQVINLGPGGPILGDLEVDMDLSMNIYELGGLYRLSGDGLASSAFDIIGGLRQVDMTTEINILPPGPGGMPIGGKIDISETDIFIGARLVGEFSEKWHYKLRADIAGGGTEGTINGLAAVGYTFGQTGLFSLDLGYRYMKIELKDGDADTTIKTEITMSGPILGFIFNF
jgi:hypothetical protein